MLLLKYEEVMEICFDSYRKSENDRDQESHHVMAWHGMVSKELSHLVSTSSW